MRYQTSCVSAKAEDIDKMLEKARQISYKTFLRYVDIDELQDLFPVYAWRNGISNLLRLKDDYAVFYYKSIYRGEKCVFVEHSRVDYVFV